MLSYEKIKQTASS